MLRSFAVAGVLSLGGCATVVEGHERALFSSASRGISHDTVGAGWYWHLPWNHYLVYDMRWQSHQEEIHIHSRDGLHLNLIVAVVVRPNPKEIYLLDLDAGPGFYQQLVRPAVFGATRDATAKFDHIAIATQTHDVEQAIHAAILEHLQGQHLEIAEVAIQHFDLPPEVEEAANRKAAASQLLEAKNVDLELAKSDAEIKKAQRKGAIETEGLERRLHAEQELEQTNAQIKIEKEKRKAELEKVEAEAEAVKIRAAAEADAIRTRAEAEKVRIAALSTGSANYVRLQAVEALAKVFGSPNLKVFVLPAGPNGLPAFLGPLMNPYGQIFGDGTFASDKK